jgi:hypothetical protein
MLSLTRTSRPQLQWRPGDGQQMIFLTSTPKRPLWFLPLCKAQLIQL